MAIRLAAYLPLACLTIALNVGAADFGNPVIEVVDPSAIKGIKRVAVTSFTVQYVTS